MKFGPLLALAIAVLLAGKALAGWDEGVTAYQRQDWTRAAAEFRPLAAQGNAGAQARLGHMLFAGLGGIRDDNEAIKLLNSAAAAGDPVGQHWLASAYFIGRAVPKDQATALVWFGRAAAQDYPESLQALGEINFNGLGVTKDESKGVGYFRRAADAGLAVSQEKIADLSWNGRAMPQDRTMAVEYAQKAGQAGRPGAQFILGLAYLTGDGTAKDPVQASQWFGKAAAQGHPQSQHNFGALMVNGVGMPRNLVEGYFWLAVAAERAPGTLKPTYEKERDLIGSKISPSDVEIARQRVAVWQPAQGGKVLAIVPQPPSASPNPAPGTDVGPQVSAGSGFVVSRDGAVVTAAHVIERCSAVTVVPANGPPLIASVLVKDSTNDLAVLRTGLRLSDVARFREDKPLRSGDPVVVVGFPLASLLSREANVTAGVVSAMAGIRGDQRYYQLTAPVQKGNSGGPLADMSGNVVGVVSSKLNAMKIAAQSGDLPQNINFAIKGDLTRKFLDDAQISYETAPATTPLSSADVGERIKRVTVFIECKVN